MLKDSQRKAMFAKMKRSKQQSKIINVETNRKKIHLQDFKHIRNNVVLPFTLENISKVPNESGHYEFLTPDGKLLYVGVAGGLGDVGNLRHRLLSYQEKDDLQEHESKRPLRDYLKKHNVNFKVFVEPISIARKTEKNLKQSALFNQDNQMNNSS